MSLFNLTYLLWVWHRLNIEILLKYCNSSGEIMEWNYFKISWRREDWSWPYFLFWLQSALRNVWKIYNLAGPGKKGARTKINFSIFVRCNKLRLWVKKCPMRCIENVWKYMPPKNVTTLSMFSHPLGVTLCFNMEIVPLLFCHLRAVEIFNVTLSAELEWNFLLDLPKVYQKDSKCSN